MTPFELGKLLGVMMDNEMLSYEMIGEILPALIEDTVFEEDKEE